MTCAGRCSIYPTRLAESTGRGFFTVLSNVKNLCIYGLTKFFLPLLVFLNFCVISRNFTYFAHIFIILFFHFYLTACCEGVFLKFLSSSKRPFLLICSEKFFEAKKVHKMNNFVSFISMNKNYDIVLLITYIISAYMVASDFALFGP